MIELMKENVLLLLLLLLPLELEEQLELDFQFDSEEEQLEEAGEQQEQEEQGQGLLQPKQRGHQQELQRRLAGFFFLFPTLLYELVGVRIPFQQVF